MTVEEFAGIDVTTMAAWILSIQLEDWPQQDRAGLRPSMVTDQGWYGFGRHAWAIIYSLGFDSTQVYQLMLSAVMPGHSIEPHKDQQDRNWLFRVHVPLATNPQACMIMDDGEHFMAVGKAYKVNTKATHAVANRGKTPRIHFMFDVRG